MSSKHTVGMKTTKVAAINVFLRSLALPKPLNTPSKVKAIALNGCAIITIQKVASNKNYFWLSLKTCPILK